MRKVLVAVLVSHGGCTLGTDDVTESEFASQVRGPASLDGGTIAQAPDASSGVDSGASAEPPSGDGGACEGADRSQSPAALHAAAVGLLTAQTPCGFSACHTGSRAKAGLRLSGVTDLRAALVGQPSCEAPSVPLVSGVGGSSALEQSWLWIKLTRHDGGGDALPVVPSWGTPLNCGQAPAEPYGRLMPLAAGSLLDDELAIVRNWICAGAPGPT